MNRYIDGIQSLQARSADISFPAVDEMELLNASIQLDGFGSDRSHILQGKASRIEHYYQWSSSLHHIVI